MNSIHGAGLCIVHNLHATNNGLDSDGDRHVWGASLVVLASLALTYDNLWECGGT